MSLVDALALPALGREADHSSTTTQADGQRPRTSQAIEKDGSLLITTTSPMAIENTQQADRTRPSYRDSLPDAPRPVCPSSFEEDLMLDSIFDANADMLATAQPRKPDAGGSPPALPQRSSLRSSRMLSSFAELKQPASSTPPSASAVTLAHAEPHEIYLSSEEDGSSSADDFSDYDLSENEESDNKGPDRKSQEVTAKLVSVVFSGRPSIISVSPVRASRPASSAYSDSAPAPRALTRAATDSSLCATSARPLSITSVGGSTSQRHPPRTSSMLLAGSPTISGSSIGSSKKPAFLNIDPFSSSSSSSASQSPIEEEELESQDCFESPAPRTPKTPSAMFRRGLNLVKKRSRPLLSNFGPFDPVPASMPALHIQTSVERPHDPLTGLHTPTSAANLPQGDFHYDIFLAKPTRKLSTPVTTPISTPISPGFSPANAYTGSPARGGRGRLLGFRRQSLNFRGAP